MFSTGCRLLLPSVTKCWQPFRVPKTVPRTVLSHSQKSTTRVLFYARAKGLEPSTFRVHLTHYFHSGMDYIFTLSLDVGIPVSSLYGAPILFVFVYGVPSVFAYLAVLIGHYIKRLSLHRYPGKFQSPFRRESCTSTGGRSNQLSYARK